MYKAVFIDVDGTLIRNDHSVSPATARVIHKLKERSILVILVSARPLSGMKRIAEKIGLITSPLISLNGAYIVFGGNTIFDAAINAALAKALYERAQKYDATKIYYQRDRWFSQSRDSNTNYEQKITSVPIIVEPFAITLQAWEDKSTGPNKILIIATESVINEIKNDLQKYLKEHLNIYTSKATYLEVMDKRASKIKAVVLLAKLFNIKQKEIVAIGDNFNDKEMIEYAGLGIAMGNAPHEVKSVADYVTDTNDNDGVSKALTKLIEFKYF